MQCVPWSARNEPALTGEVSAGYHKRTARDEGALAPRTFAGHRNRTPGLSRRLKGHILTFIRSKIADIAPLESPEHFAVNESLEKRRVSKVTY